MKLSEVQRILNAEVLCCEELLNKEIQYACSADLMSDVLAFAFAKEESLLLTGLTNAQVVRTAEMIDSVAIVFVRGKKPTHDVIELAKKSNLPLLTTPHFMYEACCLLYAGGLIGHLEKEH